MEILLPQLPEHCLLAMPEPSASPRCSDQEQSRGRRGKRHTSEQPQALQEEGFTLNLSSFMPGEKKLTPEPAKLRFYIPLPAACSCQTQKGSRAGSEIWFPAHPAKRLRSHSPAEVLRSCPTGVILGLPFILTINHVIITWCTAFFPVRPQPKTGPTLFQPRMMPLWCNEKGQMCQ